MEMEKNVLSAPRGVGNQVSCEFNLVYRWHSCISERDDKWTQELYKKLFNKPASEVSMGELLQGLSKLEASLDEDPTKREFANLKRGEDGKYSDDDLAKILIDSIEDCAGKRFGPNSHLNTKSPKGASGALNVPSSLRSVEILGMLQARAWKCATL
jgi:linoleate 10R-lipoxygenase